MQTRTDITEVEIESMRNPATRREAFGSLTGRMLPPLLKPYGCGFADGAPARGAKFIWFCPCLFVYLHPN